MPNSANLLSLTSVFAWVYFRDEFHYVGHMDYQKIEFEKKYNSEILEQNLEF